MTFEELAILIRGEPDERSAALTLEKYATLRQIVWPREYFRQIASSRPYNNHPTEGELGPRGWIENPYYGDGR